MQPSDACSRAGLQRDSCFWNEVPKGTVCRTSLPCGVWMSTPAARLKLQACKHVSECCMKITHACKMCMCMGRDACTKHTIVEEAACAWLWPNIEESFRDGNLSTERHGKIMKGRAQDKTRATEMR